jgi:hypothetical protein
MWSLGFLEMNKRNEIFNRIIEILSIRNIELDDIKIGRLFLWGNTSEGCEFWGNLSIRQLRFIHEHTFVLKPSIIEVDDEI